jgi:hypothetical protein
MARVPITGAPPQQRDRQSSAAILSNGGILAALP